MKINDFFENIFAYGLDERKINAIEKIYGGKIHDATTALVVSCMRERTLVVDGKKNRYILLTLDEILKPNEVFAKAKILPLFKADEDRYICYNFNASEKNKIADSCLFNLKTKKIEQQYPGLLLLFKDDIPETEISARTNKAKGKFVSLMFFTSDRKIMACFFYDIVAEKGVQINTVCLITANGEVWKDVDILVPFHPTEKFDKMMSKLKEEKELYQVELNRLRADWLNQLAKLRESEKFTTKAMLEMIKDIDMYANAAPIYETMLEKIENKEI